MIARCREPEESGPYPSSIVGQPRHLSRATICRLPPYAIVGSSDYRPAHRRGQRSPTCCPHPHRIRRLRPRSVTMPIQLSFAVHQASSNDDTSSASLPTVSRSWTRAHVRNHRPPTSPNLSHGSDSAPPSPVSSCAHRPGPTPTSPASHPTNHPHARPPTPSRSTSYDPKPNRATRPLRSPIPRSFSPAVTPTIAVRHRVSPTRAPTITPDPPTTLSPTAPIRPHAQTTRPRIQFTSIEAVLPTWHAPRIHPSTAPAAAEPGGTLPPHEGHTRRGRVPAKQMGKE